ncbi:hypothetical protein Poli38472_009389 [Pythium oligandrum]|uniref:Uncharacterized protein n=1 Tax=Pythium oligandrum TaxID=41045 RepID=A0A8K1FMU8_PYTOL|nr:hypothetical protein Poli38472_009389 [Pythium oligandrum]|eukprot:TMW65222.1 hypothetical protein Poli38472_009389 [Pythium oligandrum]
MASSDMTLSGSSVTEVFPSTTSRPLAPQDYLYNYTLQGGTCSHYSRVGNTGCLQPRSCSDCLLKQGCMINQFGQCVDQVTDGYNPGMDFRLAQEQGLVMPPATPPIMYNEQRWHFPAFGAAYCQASDLTCESCRQANFWFTGDFFLSDSRYCIGQDGCICVWSCETSARAYHVSEDCSPIYTPTWNNYPSSTASSFSAIAIIAIVVGISIILAFLICVANRRYQKQQARLATRQQELRQAAQTEREQSRMTAVFGLPSLNLSGWIQYRRDLIAKEHSQFEQTVDITLQGPDPSAYVSIEEAELDVGVVAAERHRHHNLQHPSSQVTHL